MASPVFAAVVAVLLAAALLQAHALPTTRSPTPSAGPVRAGIMYEGWHGPAVAGLRDPATTITIERLLRSNGTLTFKDAAAGVDESVSMNFYFHKEPADGFYCIYRKRDGESAGPIPDCANITATLTRHAAMLSGNGLDFVVCDSTNIQSTGAAADMLQLRPFEVLAEEWLALRRRGVQTPQIAIWQNLQDPNGNLWRAYADGVYSNKTWAQPNLLLHSPRPLHHMLPF